MMYVLDTNVLSELRKVRLAKADANVGAWAESVDAADLFISAISVMELELGVLSIERRDAAQGRMLRSWLEPNARCPSIPSWPSVAPGCMCLTGAASAMRSSLRRPW